MPIRQLLIVLSLGAVAGLSSCGGGGGGSSHPGFPTIPANLTAANAPTFARFVDLAARAGATMRLGEFLTNTGPNTFSDGGCLAIGSSPATISLNAPTGSVSGTATYLAFDRCFGMRVNGTANVTGTMQIGNRVDAMSFNFSSPNNLTFVAGTETIQASGTAALDWTSVAPDATYVMTLNATASGAASFRVENFRIDSQVVGITDSMLLSGRLTTSDGFVDIAAGPTRLSLPGPTTGLQGGQITMTGATTIATVLYNAPGNIIITIAPR